MATQPIDRKNTKHHAKVDKRKAPEMVRRSNKLVLLDGVAPRHIATMIDSQITYWGAPRYWGSNY